MGPYVLAPARFAVLLGRVEKNLDVDTLNEALIAMALDAGLQGFVRL